MLLVEGKDDESVAWHILGKHPDRPKVCVKNANGIERLLKAISPAFKTPGLTAFGILVDANSDPSSRWRKVSSKLRALDVQPPDQMERAGTIINGSPRVGIWLMPDNESPGELEDFIKRLIPAGDAVWPLAQKYICNIPKGDRKFTSTKAVRAQVHAWLAAREQPRKMGTAIRTGDLSMQAPLAICFAGWLKRLFG